MSLLGGKEMDEEVEKAFAASAKRERDTCVLEAEAYMHEAVASLRRAHVVLRRCAKDVSKGDGVDHDLLFAVRLAYAEIENVFKEDK